MSEQDEITRKYKNIDDKKLKHLMRCKPTLPDTAFLMGCSEKTVQDYINDKYQMNFRQFRNTHLAETRYSIQRAAIEQALKGNMRAIEYCQQNLDTEWKPLQDGIIKVEHAGKVIVEHTKDPLLEAMLSELKDVTPIETEKQQGLLTHALPDAERK